MVVTMETVRLELGIITGKELVAWATKLRERDGTAGLRDHGPDLPAKKPAEERKAAAEE
jgi:hypothetical protein